METLFSWVSGPSVPNEQDNWLKWQSCQKKEHFQSSDIYTYYKKNRTNFSTNKNYYTNPVYRYCFGDYSYLLVNPKDINAPCTTIVEYIALIIDFYDVCKGITRRFTWDPEVISMLRSVIRENNISLLKRYNFEVHHYDYCKLHAHTVAQYSISTLLGFFVSNYLDFFKETLFVEFPKINIFFCQKALIEKSFGSGAIAESFVKSSSMIDIVSSKPPTKEPRWYSWPTDKTNFLYCLACKRVTEKHWGEGCLCLDCHVQKSGISSFSQDSF
jgi:hypothetical protein